MASSNQSYTMKSHQLQQGPPPTGLYLGSSKAHTPTSPISHLQITSGSSSVPNNQQGASLKDFGTSKPVTTPLIDLANNGSSGSIGCMKFTHGMDSYTIDTPGLYYIGYDGISKVPPYDHTCTPTTPPAAPTQECERWMKVKSLEPVYNVRLDYIDLRKNWRRFAALSNHDKTLRFNTPRLRETRRAIFGEMTGLGGMRNRRDAGIDYTQKEAMVNPRIDLKLLRNKKKPPPVFRSVPKIYYTWSNKAKKRRKNKLSAPQVFYDWSKRMEKRKYIEPLVELTDLGRSLSNRVDSEECSCSNLDSDIDLGAPCIGGNGTLYEPKGINTGGDDSGSSYTLDGMVDEYLSGGWVGIEG